MPFVHKISHHLESRKETVSLGKQNVKDSNNARFVFAFLLSTTYCTVQYLKTIFQNLCDAWKCSLIIVLAIQQLQFSRKIQSTKMPEYSFYLFFFSVNWTFGVILELCKQTRPRWLTRGIYKNNLWLKNSCQDFRDRMKPSSSQAKENDKREFARLIFANFQMINATTID